MPRPSKKPFHQAFRLTNESLLAKTDPHLAANLLRQNFPLPGTDELEFGAMPPHTAVIGSTGTGKTLILKSLMAAVLAASSDKGGLKFRAVVYDPKRELYPFLHALEIASQQIIVTHPFDSRSACWDLASDFTEIAQIEELAEMIVPQTATQNKSNSSEFFESTSRIIIQDVIEGLISVSPKDWELRDVIEAVSSKRILKAVLMKTKNGADSWNAYLRPLENDAQDRTALSVFASLATYVRPFQSLAALWHRSEQKFSMESWINGSGILLLGADPKRERTLQRVNQLLMRRVCQIVLGRKEERPVDLTWFFLDEVREAGKLNGLRQLMTEGRSKGARVVLGFQDIAGLHSLYEENEAEEMIGLCANRLVLHLDNPKTRKWASEFFGEAEVVQPSLGVSNSTTGVSSSSESYQYGIAMRSTVLPIEFHEMPLGSIKEGVYGWYAIPGRRNTFFFPPDKAKRMAYLSENSKQPAFSERPKEHQRHIPWTTEDLDLLKIEPPKKIKPKSKSKPDIQLGEL